MAASDGDEHVHDVSRTLANQTLIARLQGDLADGPQ